MYADDATICDRPSQNQAVIILDKSSRIKIEKRKRTGASLTKLQSFIDFA